MILSLSSIPTDMRIPILTWARHVATKYKVSLTMQVGPEEPIEFLPTTTVKTATAIRAEYDVMMQNTGMLMLAEVETWA